MSYSFKPGDCVRSRPGYRPTRRYLVFGVVLGRLYLLACGPGNGPLWILGTPPGQWQFVEMTS